MIDKETLKALEAHEDFRTIHAAGKERKWLLGRCALRIARDTHHVEVMSESSEDGMEFAARALWAGCLPWEPDLDYEPFADALSFSEMVSATSLLNPTPTNGKTEAKSPKKAPALDA